MKKIFEGEVFAGAGEAERLCGKVGAFFITIQPQTPERLDDERAENSNC